MAVRFKIWHLMAFAGVVAVLVGAWVETGGRWGSVVWEGESTIPLEFLVTDAETLKPIPNATVAVFEDGPPTTTTYIPIPSGPRGRFRFVSTYVTSGRDRGSRQTRSVYYGRWMVKAEAKGYRSLETDLKQLTRGRAYHYDATPPPIVIRLRRHVQITERSRKP